MKEYLKRILVALDQLLQACFRKGLPGETISARAGKAAKRKKAWGCLLCKILNLIQDDHCNKAIKHDLLRAQAVIDDLKDYSSE